MSAPATNAFSPAPVMITQRTRASPSASRSAQPISFSVCRLRALSAFSRATVIVAMNPSTSYRTFSYDGIAGSSVFVETAPRFAAEPAGRDILAEQRRRPILVVAELGVQHFRDRQARIEPDQIRQFERTHRVIQSELHALIDVLDRSERLLQREARLVQERNQQAIDDESRNVLRRDELL